MVTRVRPISTPTALAALLLGGLAPACDPGRTPGDDRRPLDAARPGPTVDAYVPPPARLDAGPPPDLADARPDAANALPDRSPGPGDARPDARADARSDAADAAAGADRGPADAAMAPDLGPGWHMPRRALCAGNYGPPEDAAMLADVALRETSGIVASPTTPRVYWMHNDSGDTPRLFATRDDGAALGHLFLQGVASRDIEDIDAAPCPDGSGPCLYVADIGNNLHGRRDLIVYAVPEPPVDVEAGLGEALSAPVWRFPFHYPEAANPDAEGVAVLPDGSAFYIFEKVDWDQSRVWRSPDLRGAPRAPEAELELLLVGSLDNPGLARPSGRQITGAELHAGGARLVLRVYSGIYEYRLDPAFGLDRLELAERVEVVQADDRERQGEAVCYDAAGRSIVSVGEGDVGFGGRTLHRYPCLDP